MGTIIDILKEIPLSAVLKERLAEIEKHVAQLERDNAALKAENSSLKLQLPERRQPIPLEGLERNILLLLSNGRNVPLGQICQSLGEKLVRAEYYLKRLEDRDMVGHVGFYTGRESEYYIKQEGRAYVVENDMV